MSKRIIDNDEAVGNSWVVATHAATSAAAKQQAKANTTKTVMIAGGLLLLYTMFKD